MPTLRVILALLVLYTLTLGPASPVSGRLVVERAPNVGGRWPPYR
ncbi:hypothetical protein ACFYOK_31050 [Microbispora bryophytorum]